MRNFLIFFFPLFLVGSLSAQVKSPQEFLGYPIGKKYTNHWKILAYFKSVADAAPSQVKLQQYGETNEGRPLILAFISSTENIGNLENIRKNNQRLANQSPDKMAPAESGAPAIVWLSYNVHGNETSSSEAAMLTLYALVDPSNNQTREWLKNTVVVIDPCINPDGRERYVNWFNSVVGATPNPRLEAREHSEPWPGGRTNHYNFDLNRDWAWQTQVESQQRLKVYQQWLPQIHVDFHEQGVNSPYYFAPAAQPYHEVISKWQRDFQVSLGRNHAKYFDREGWLYFTKEVFDLFYPSYGDTYPLYNGAVGMTYEQAGGPAGGAAALKADGDTLSLYDRAIHHYTTGLSTIEMASKNAASLIAEFRRYFNDALQNGSGEYKTYLIRNKPEDAQRIAALKQLLDKNAIQYEYAGVPAKGSITGYSYETGKDASFTPASRDLLIQAQQTHAAMVRVLFEPRSQLVDSVTYDITAWSLPYVYGLSAYASKTKINGGPASFSPDINNQLEDAYGYVLPWQGVQSARLLGQLLQKGMKLRFAEHPFDIGNQHFERGSLILIKTGNESNWKGMGARISELGNQYGIQISAVNTGFVDKGYDFGSEKVHFLHAPRVLLLTGEGTSSNDAGEIWHFFEKVIEYPVTLSNVNDMRRVNMDDYNVLIMPSGFYSFLNDKDAAGKLRDWISKGGKLIALDRAVTQLARLDWTLQSKKEEDPDKKDEYANLKIYEDRERDNLRSFIPGSIYKVELDNTHPLAFGYPGYYYTLKQDDNMYNFLKDGWNVGVIKKENQVAGFVGSALKEKLKDGVIFGVQDIGRGSVVYFADNVLFRSFWENGKLLFCNALFLVGE